MTRLRDQHAAAIRRSILQAARALFTEQGYNATSMKQLAERAGVAVQTIYSTYGSKAGVVRAMTDLIDEESGIWEVFQAIQSAEDPGERLVLFARGRRLIRERCGDIVRMLRQGAVVDAETAQGWAEGMRRRHGVLTGILRSVDEAGLLKPGLDAARATDIAAALVTDDVCDVLVEQRGWTFDEYEAWLGSTLRDLLVEDPSPARRGSKRR